jgi:hypothetical protein
MNLFSFSRTNLARWSFTEILKEHLLSAPKHRRLTAGGHQCLIYLSASTRSGVGETDDRALPPARAQALGRLTAGAQPWLICHRSRALRRRGQVHQTTTEQPQRAPNLCELAANGVRAVHAAVRALATLPRPRYRRVPSSSGLLRCRR